HRPVRSREVGHTDARALVLGFRLPELELPSRASLLRRRAVLSAAGAAAGAHAVLRAPRHAMAELFRPALRLVRQEPRSAYGLGGRRRRDHRDSRAARETT